MSAEWEEIEKKFKKSEQELKEQLEKSKKETERAAKILEENSKRMEKISRDIDNLKISPTGPIIKTDIAEKINALKQKFAQEEQNMQQVIVKKAPFKPVTVQRKCYHCGRTSVVKISEKNCPKCKRQFVK